MGGGSLAGLLKDLSPEISVALVSRLIWTADMRHLSERKEQGFHIRFWVGEPEMESGCDFRFPCSSQRVKEEPEVDPDGCW
jgi:hypothetical protein